MKKAGEVFDNVCDYDGEIEKVVPHYCEIHQTIIDSLPFEASESFSLLELGTGTGNLAAVGIPARENNVCPVGDTVHSCQ